MSRRAWSVLAATALLTASCVGSDSDPPVTTVPTTPAPTTTTTRATTTTTLPIFPRIAWSMPDRFGLDGDDDGRIDVPNTAEYLRGLAPGACADGCPEATFPVVLTGAGSTSDAGPIEEYRWEVRSGSEVVFSAASADAEVEVALPEGRYDVSLTVIAGGRSELERDTIEVRDHLIVALGDSYASGEGNPERSEISGSGRADGIWADDGMRPDGPVGEGHRQAHRSTLAASPQAALEVESGDAQSSVTLLFLARSGAKIGEGMLVPQPGLDPGVSDSDLLAQVDAVARLLGCEATADGPRCDRTIDALTFSIGGNDIGFNVLIGGLVAADPDLSFRRAYDFAINQLLALAEASIRNLEEQYADLDAAIRAQLEVDEVYLIGYPAATGLGEGLCNLVAEDLVPGLEADREEIGQTVERVVGPLTDAMAAAAAAHEWTFVDAHLAEFGRHGYCRDDPYPPASYPGNPFPDPVEAAVDGDVRWFRRAIESAQIQGGVGGRFEPANLATDGTLHPNELGHQSIKRALLAVLELD